MTSIQSFNRKVCVAVKFDDPSRRAIKLAEQYCRRTGSAIHLVHVCEDIVTSNWSAVASSGLVGIPGEVVQMAQDNIKELAESEVSSLARLVKAGVEVSQSVLSGVDRPAELIEAEARTKGCDIIFVAASPGTYRFVPRGFSCALSLMSNSKLPVVVINKDQTTELSDEHLRLVIADDLKPHSATAVAGACALAIALGKTEIDHVHINGITEDAIQGALQTAFAVSRSQPDPAISSAEVFQSTMRQLENRLEQRSVGLSSSLEKAGGRYNKVLVTETSITDGLERYVKEKKANLVVLGRHQTFYHKPFSVGQMPYYAMLALNCPIVVFPQA